MANQRTQTTENQRGEITFRRLLVEQQTGGRIAIEGEFDAAGIEAILRARMSKTVQQISALRNRGVDVSAYLELGAERGQRALAIENELNLTGAAADLSFDMLKSCEYYRQQFALKKMPLLICCDAYHLPFASNSLPFVFCYETLHHFPDPAPILREVHRVLKPGGAFFFEEEPYKQILRASLYRSGKICSKGSRARGHFRRIVDRFLAKKECNETTYGIIENEDISLSEWRRALRPFVRCEVSLAPSRAPTADLFASRLGPKYVLASLLGGNVSGICYKADVGATPTRPGGLVVICPSCLLARGVERELRGDSRRLYCPDCSEAFPVVEGVRFVMPQERINSLYPELSAI